MSKRKNQKRQRNIRVAAYILEAVVFVASIGFAVTDAHATKTGQYVEDTRFPVNTVIETESPVKHGKFDVTEEVTEHEHEASEETHEEETDTTEEDPGNAARLPTAAQEEVRETVEGTVEEDREGPIYYAYKGREVLDHRLQYHLYDLWQRFDMPEGWYKYAIGLIYQECSFHKDSINHNPDGSSDIGYFQYNTRWFSGTAAKYGSPDLDINNNFHQAYLFVLQTKARMNQGLSLEECISRHRRGDYDGYDAEYVALVFQRTANLTEE